MVESTSATDVVLGVIRVEHPRFLQGASSNQSYAEFNGAIEQMRIPVQDHSWLRGKTKAYLIENYRARDFNAWKFLKDLRMFWETHSGQHSLDARRKQLEITERLEKHWLMSKKKDVSQWERVFEFADRVVAGEPADDVWREVGGALGLRTDVHPFAYDVYKYCPPEFRDRCIDLTYRWRAGRAEPVTAATKVAEARGVAPNPEEDSIPFARPTSPFRRDLT